MMKLNIFREVSARVPKQKIFKLFEKIMTEETEPNAVSRINLVFTTKKCIRQLNKANRGKDIATDVLSFNIDNDGEDETVFGEIYISTDIAKVQAEKFHNTFSEELLRLTCHGLLHLLGYDHSGKTDAVKMQKREQYFLSLVGDN